MTKKMKINAKKVKKSPKKKKPNVQSSSIVVSSQVVSDDDYEKPAGYITVVVHHGGDFKPVDRTLPLMGVDYKGNVSSLDCDPDKWSYFEVLGILKDSNYEEIIGMWFESPTEGLKPLDDDAGAMEMVTIANAHGEVHLYIVHPNADDGGPNVDGVCQEHDVVYEEVDSELMVHFESDLEDILNADGPEQEVHDEVGPDIGVQGVQEEIGPDIGVQGVQEEIGPDIVWRAGDGIFEVRHLNLTGDKYVVNLGEMNCSCRKWSLTGVPCGHAISCMQHNNVNPEDFIPTYYRKANYEACYSSIIYPANGSNLWPKTTYTDLQPPPIKRQPGRPKKNRNKDAAELVREDGSVRKCGLPQKCSRCHKSGHNKARCPLPPTQQSTTPAFEIGESSTQASQVTQQSTTHARDKGTTTRATGIVINERVQNPKRKKLTTVRPIGPV